MFLQPSFQKQTSSMLLCFSVEHSLPRAATLLPEVGQLGVSLGAKTAEQAHSCSGDRKRCARTAQHSAADKHRRSRRPITHVQ